MQVVKRNGQREDVSFDKILNRVRNRSEGLKVEPVLIAQKVVAGLCDGITTRELDRLLIETAAVLAPEHPDYDKLAAAIAASALHKETPDSFWDAWKALHDVGVLSDQFMWDARALRAKELESIIDYSRDFNFSYFGFKTLESKYLLGIVDTSSRKRLADGSWASERKIVERPQSLFLRVAIGICGDNIAEVKKLYDYLSLGYYTHATPTLFNAGTNRPQMSSCFLISTRSDSLEGIYDTDKECALISKNSGGVGLWIHNVRADGAVIQSSQRFSDGIIPMLRHANATFRYVNQGGKRRGSAAIYLEPWHADIEAFLDLRKNTGDDERRCHDLFTALWVPDLFMKRLQENGKWTLFSPDEAPGLFDCYGEDFEKLYERYEAEGLGRKTIKASDLMKRICSAQKETGTPYMLYKDAANRKSNQKNLGTIKSSNLCFTGDTLVAVADGRNAVSIQKLAEEGGEFLVYSAKKRKQLKRGVKGGGVQHRGAWQAEIKEAVAFKTGTRKVIAVRLSNGDVIRCTPDHRIALLDGGYIEAKDSLNSELASFYTVNYDMFAYRYINGVSSASNKQSVMLWNYYNPENGAESGYHIDHINKHHRPFDAIENLQKLTRDDHFEKTALETSGSNNAVFKIRDLETYRENKRRLALGKKNRKYCGLDNYELIELGKTMLKAIGDINSTIYIENAKKFDDRAPLALSNYRFGGSWAEFLRYVREEAEYDGRYEVELDQLKSSRSTDEMRLEYIRKHFLEYQPNGDIYERGLRVTEIFDLGEEDVYDLTVQDNHNFYIITSSEDDNYLNCQGVLVHNCTEIIEYSSAEETAVCNLASICLPKFVADGGYDFESLRQVAYDATINLNHVIDKNFYPTPATRNSNLKHRPIGIGVQGLADTFMKMRLPYDSTEARKLNHEIFETIYLGAMQASVDLAEKNGPYESFYGSPLSKGLFQFDLWKGEHEVPLRYQAEWEHLRGRVKMYGARNSLLLAPMPTASTSQIFDNFEAFEIHTSNLYKRETLAGEFVVINKHLVNHLQELGLWDRRMMDQIITNNGSVQQILRIPEDVRKIYRTVWEVSQKVVIDMATDRAVFVCQSQSMNIHMANPSIDQLASLHLYAWKRGLKTGMYYLRTKAAKESVKVTVSEQIANDATACSIDNPEACDVCSS